MKYRPLATLSETSRRLAVGCTLSTASGVSLMAELPFRVTLFGLWGNAKAPLSGDLVNECDG